MKAINRLVGKKIIGKKYCNIMVNGLLFIASVRFQEAGLGYFLSYLAATNL